MIYTPAEMIELSTKDFDIRQILDCGQIFRYEKIDEGKYFVYSLDKRCLVEQKGDCVKIYSKDKDYFWHYFDLDRDYSEIKDMLRQKPFMANAVEYGSGIRILNQDRWEMLISFIISANNHIPRIKGIIRRLCDKLGKDMGEYKAFPTAQSMASEGEAFYAELGAGYRAKYLADTAHRVAEGFDLERIENMQADKANKYLCNLLGVGEKVADCILLFGYHKSDVFPVDTWIRKVYKDIFGETCENKKIIRERLINLYSKELAGYAQQYLFFNKRDMN